MMLRTQLARSAARARMNVCATAPTTIRPAAAGAARTFGSTASRQAEVELTIGISQYFFLVSASFDGGESSC